MASPEYIPLSDWVEFLQSIASEHGADATVRFHRNYGFLIVVVPGSKNPTYYNLVTLKKVGA